MRIPHVGPPSSPALPAKLYPDKRSEMSKLWLQQLQDDCERWGGLGWAGRMIARGVGGWAGLGWG